MRRKRKGVEKIDQWGKSLFHLSPSPPASPPPITIPRSRPPIEPQDSLRVGLLLAEVTEAVKQSKKEEIENHFKVIQEAHEVLTDPARRKVYDSVDEFDDEIPTDCSLQDFFKVFAPAFTRNGRWSGNQPAPSLEEFDLEQAESRGRKRWIKRQNVKHTEKARKEAYAPREHRTAGVCLNLSLLYQGPNITRIS
ncbi:hypothetical protein U1Q18_017746 [Sarracenia purpurea var. burkii]